MYIYYFLDANPPVPNYESKNPTFYKNQELYYSTNVIGNIDYCIISPELNIPGLEFSTINGEIFGVINGYVEQQSYTVTCKNDIGISSSELNITISNSTLYDACEEEQKAYIFITVNTLDFPSRIGLTINYKNGSTLLSLNGLDMNWETNRQYSFSKCVPQGLYTCTKTSTSTDGWEFQNIIIELYGAALGSYSMNEEEPTTTYQLSRIFLLYYYSTIYFRCKKSMVIFSCISRKME